MHGPSNARQAELEPVTLGRGDFGSLRRERPLSACRTLRLGSILLALLMGTAWATSYRALELSQMLERAELAFYGEVAALETEARDGEPWTLVIFTPLTPLAGLEEGQETVQLAFYGGTLETGESLSVSLMPRFEVGERVLVLAYDDPYYSPIVGFRQGLWRESALGLRDETGRLLSLGEDGALALEGEGGASEAILEALREALEARP